MTKNREHVAPSEEDKNKLFSALMSSKRYKDNSVGIFLKWRNFTAAFLMFNCGLRPAEALNLRWSEINFEKSEIAISPLNNKQRSNKPAVLTSQAKEALLDYHEVLKEIGVSFTFCFPSLETFMPLSVSRYEKIIKEFAKEAGILKVEWVTDAGYPQYNISGYTGRRWFGTEVYKRTYSDIAVQHLMRHKNRASSEPYTHLPLEEIKKISKKIFN